MLALIATSCNKGFWMVQCLRRGDNMSCTQTLREQGYRLTPQRLLILSAIHNSDHHISAEEIHDQVRHRYPNVNISTVYRTLELLKDLGLATETDLGGGRFRYHSVEKGHHHHLVCRKCGEVFELDESALLPLEETILRQYRFKADLSHLAVFGHCARCQR
jgi:Fur family ferric uptake transcriptional regulator